MASMFADLAAWHKAHKEGHDNVPAAGLISELIQENNEKLLAQVAAMIQSSMGMGPPATTPGRAAAQRQLQAASGNEATAANLENAGMWIEEDGAKLCFGNDAATSLYRPAPVKILQRTFLGWTPCFSQPCPGFSFLRIALPFHDRTSTRSSR